MHRFVFCVCMRSVCMLRAVLCWYAQAHSMSVCTGLYVQSCSVSICTGSFCVCMHRLVLCLCAWAAGSFCVCISTGLFCVCMHMLILCLCAQAHSVFVCMHRSICTGLFSVCIHVQAHFVSVCTLCSLYQCMHRLVLCLSAQARLAEAVKVKVSGNEAFKLGHFSEAMEYYTQGLELCPLKYVQQRSIMFSNRAACRMKEVGFAKEKKRCC